MPQLNEDRNDYICQQDGSPAHYKDVRRYLNRNLPQRCVGRTGKEDDALMRWPLRSPDLTPSDFFFWGFVKDTVSQSESQDSHCAPSVRMYIPTYIYTYLYTYIRTYIHTHAYIHTYIRTYIQNTYIHTYVHTYTHTYIHTYIYTYIHTYIHTYIYTYIHIYTHLQQYAFPRLFV